MLAPALSKLTEGEGLSSSSLKNSVSPPVRVSTQVSRLSFSPTKVSAQDTRLSTTLSARVMSSSSLLLFPRSVLLVFRDSAQVRKFSVLVTSPQLLSLFLEPRPSSDSMEADFFFMFRGGAGGAGRGRDWILSSPGDIFSVISLGSLEADCLSLLGGVGWGAPSPNDLNLFFTGTASISSSSDGCFSRDIPFLGLGDCFLGGSGGGTSSDSSWISWLLLFFLFFFPLRFLSGVALIWSARLKWSSSSSSSAGGGGSGWLETLSYLRSISGLSLLVNIFSSMPGVETGVSV